MFSKEKIAELSNILYMIIKEYSIGFDYNENRMSKLYLNRIRNENHVNGLAKFFNRQLLPDDCSLIGQYTHSCTTTTDLTRVFDPCNKPDITTFHISIITDSSKIKNIKDNYCIISKDYKNCYIAIPKRMVELSDSNEESINFFIPLLHFICQGYWYRNLVPYLFCKYIYNIKGDLRYKLYNHSSKLFDSDIESYINTELPNLYTESLSNIIKRELYNLQEGNDNIWNYLTHYDEVSETKYTIKIPYYYWKEDKDIGNGKWVEY